MSLNLILIASAVILSAAYLIYGRLLSRLFRLNDANSTPAVEMRDDNDYVPIEAKTLLPQHFSAIAAAGPIVGPILAGLMFGWLPALIWILVGSIFIGGVHDFAALVASIRHKARSIGEVVRDHMSQRSYILFLSFVWLALVYIIVAFTDVTAQSFVGAQTLEDGTKVTGGAIASSSILYLILPIIMGLLLRYRVINLRAATILFVPLVGVTIWVGKYIPFDIAHIFNLSDSGALKAWDVTLLVYCLLAGVAPVWLLLQPRGYLGGWFLYVALLGGGLGLILTNPTIEFPAERGWTTPKGDTLAPMLFITIACGACSGFHSLIASGTTSKQLRRESDARTVGYGSMLLEAMVAIVSLACVMVLATDSALLKGQPKPNYIYALGIGSFLEFFHVPSHLGVSFALMAFTTFVYDTLDVCTRLGRYIIQELTGWHTRFGRWFGTAVTAGVPLFFVMQQGVTADGKPIPLWQMFWSLFGASNQLLAALTLLGVTVWLWRTRRAWWVWLVTGVPTVFMYTMSTWALLSMIAKGASGDIFMAKIVGSEVAAEKLRFDIVLWIAVVLVALAALMLVEAIRVLLTMRTPREPQPQLAAEGRVKPAGQPA